MTRDAVTFDHSFSTLDDIAPGLEDDFVEENRDTRAGTKDMIRTFFTSADSGSSLGGRASMNEMSLFDAVLRSGGLRKVMGVTGKDIKV